ncbi:MAG: hypothetical protein ACLFUO_02465 [Candidatus Woesearchaeota archaeon]
MVSKKTLIFILMLLVVSTIPVDAAEPVQRRTAKMLLQSLDNYVVTVDMKNEKEVTVSQSFDIVSRHKDPIIPGRAKLVLYNGINPQNIRANIGGSYRDISPDEVILEDGNNVIYYEIWRPIAPGERLNIDVTFDTEVDAKGFLFKQLDLKFGEPELPIDKMVFTLNLPRGKRITYSDPGLTERSANSGTIEFESPGEDNQASLTVEYSSLPLPVLPFHGYWLWLLLVLASLVLFLVRYVNKDKFELPSTPFSGN